MFRRSQTQAATAVALAWSIFEGDDFDCPIITIQFATPTTTAENLTVTLNSHLGAGSDVVLATVDPIGADEITIRNIQGMVEGDTIDIAYTNTDTSSITGAAVTELSDRDYEPVVSAAGQVLVYKDGVLQVSAAAENYHYGKRVIKTSTFLNTTGAPVIFTVTGDVQVRVMAVGKTNLTSAGACNAELGIAGATSTLLATTDVTTIDADEIWHDNAPDSDIEAATVLKDYFIVGGADIILTLSAQVDAGAIAFVCWWTPISADGAVVAA